MEELIPPDCSLCCEGNMNLYTLTSAVSSAYISPVYQWQVSTNGGTSFTNITGATDDTLVVNNLTAAMTGYQYRAVLNGTCTANLNSAAATLTVNTLVAINNQPINRSICAGQPKGLPGMSYHYQNFPF